MSCDLCLGRGVTGRKPGGIFLSPDEAQNERRASKGRVWSQAPVSLGNQVRQEGAGTAGHQSAVRAVAGPGVRTGAAVGMERQEGPHRTGGKGLRWLWQQGTLSLTDCMYSLQDLSSSQVTQGRTEPEREGSGPV